jgi:tetratricopeptide (TPR) repeat protein
MFSTASGLCQQALPDSIKNLIGDVKQDSSYIIRLNSLASGYLNVNPATSRQIAAHVIETATKIKYPRGYARGLVVMGNSYWYEGIYEFAQNYYLLAARQYRTLNDSLGLAQVYNNMGEVNKRLGEMDMALEYLLRSLDMKRTDSTRAMALYNVGELYISLRDYEKATDYINQSMELARRVDNQSIIAYNQWSTARIKTEQGQYEEAFKYYEVAEGILKRLGETRSLIQTYQDIAYTHRKMNNPGKARDYLDKASLLSGKLNVPDLRITTYLEYFRVDSMAGNYQRAVYYLSRHNALKDSVYNLLKAEQIARVQAIYETEQHERENQQLRTEKDRKDAELKLRELLIVAVSVSLLIAGVLAVILFRQRKEILRANKDLKAKNEEISFQKNAIESQAEALLILNEELQDLNKTLEGRIDERTRQILHQNQRLAEYTFVNAHKLRAPIASILGLINLFQQADPKEQKVILKHLKTCADQLDSTIRTINRNLEGGIAETKFVGKQS